MPRLTALLLLAVFAAHAVAGDWCAARLAAPAAAAVKCVESCCQHECCCVSDAPAPADAPTPLPPTPSSDWRVPPLLPLLGFALPEAAPPASPLLVNCGADAPSAPPRARLCVWVI